MVAVFTVKSNDTGRGGRVGGGGGCGGGAVDDGSPEFAESLARKLARDAEELDAGLHIHHDGRLDEFAGARRSHQSGGGGGGCYVFEYFGTYFGCLPNRGWNRQENSPGTGIRE